jgi:hypothetical protein
MIAKHVAMKASKKNDFARLVKYLTDAQHKHERVGCVAVTNCQSDQHTFATMEVLNTQAQNTRAKSDKTYHLLVSFRAGEQPNDAVLKAIEERMCAGLGYGEHQRISVVHHDTDNLHIHIAINKIHLTRYTIYEPHGDYRILGRLCDTLEREFALECDKHQGHKCVAENLAADMEHHAGVESLLGWIQRECLQRLLAAGSWGELHQVMRSNGLLLHERGNGLTVTSSTGATVKASSVDRSLSKRSLAVRFGPFEPAPEQREPTQAARMYAKQPLGSGAATCELHARYKGEKQALAGARAADITRARERKDRLVAAAKRRGRIKRAAIKLIGKPGTMKRLLYALCSGTLLGDLERIQKQYRKELGAIYDKYHRQTWTDWLREKAAAGEPDALAALRARNAAASVDANTLAGKAVAKDGRRLPNHEGVTRNSTIVYRAGATAVRDDGDKLIVARGATQANLQAALRMAIARYGEKLHAEGTDAFKEQIVHAAVAAKLPVHFDDANLERRRQQLLHDANAKENQHGHLESGRTGGSGAVRNGPAATRTAAAPRTASHRPGDGGRAVGRVGKPDLGALGQRPPPASRNRLRGLSELGVVRIPGRAQVLLPGDVSDHLEQQGAAAADGMRWDVPGLALSAAAKYVVEREQKRIKGFDIPKHALYDGYAGPAAFAGIRRIEGQALALFQHDQDIAVLSVDEATVRRLERVSIGQAITVTSQGKIKKKGRRR